MLDATKTVREFAVQMPQAPRLFEKLGIDYCCGGGKSLSDACAAANLRVDEVLGQLDAAAVAQNVAADWRSATLSDLIEHIVTKHHGYIKQESPRLEALMNKVASKHGPKHTELLEVQDLLARVSAELTSHLMKEEQILFPYVIDCERAAQDSQRVRPPMFGSVRNPIHMMELEHDSAGDAMKRMREITNGFTPPTDGCMSFKALYQGLLEFEADLHQHIHLENNILFPRAIELEKRAR